MQFESASALRSHYADVRTRLYPRQVRIAPIPAAVEPQAPPLPEPVIEKSAPPPVVEAKPAPADETEQVPRIPTIRDIQKAVCAHYGLTYIDMVTHRRTLNVVRPRQVAMYLAKTMTPRTLPEIGRMFGDRDHTTILHGVRKINELIQSDADISYAVEHLKAGLANA